MTEYIVYLIELPDGRYVGSTKTGLSSRKSVHRYDSTRSKSKINKALHRIDFEEVELVELDRVIGTRKDAVDLEQKWMDSLECELNMLKATIGDMTQSEYALAWYHKNNNKCRKSYRDRYAKDPDKYRKKTQKYRDKHPEFKDKHSCGCGGSWTSKWNRKNHVKTGKHRRWMAVLEK